VARRKNTRWIVGGVVIVGTLIAMMSLNLGANMVYFLTPSEAQAQAAELGDKTVKVGGLVKAGTVVWKPEDLDLGFTVTDNEGHEIAVKHRGTPPDMFKENQGVVVEGRMTEGGKAMISKSLLVKHSEEYKKPDDHSRMNKALLEESLFKDRGSPTVTSPDKAAPAPGGAGTTP
jgi:cytochrome c-type biogenesis protein CcmE